jgi:hypothetical protein
MEVIISQDVIVNQVIQIRTEPFLIVLIRQNDKYRLRRVFVDNGLEFHFDDQSLTSFLSHKVKRDFQDQYLAPEVRYDFNEENMMTTRHRDNFGDFTIVKPDRFDQWLKGPIIAQVQYLLSGHRWLYPDWPNDPNYYRILWDILQDMFQQQFDRTDLGSFIDTL